MAAGLLLPFACRSFAGRRRAWLAIRSPRGCAGPACARARSGRAGKAARPAAPCPGRRTRTPGARGGWRPRDGWARTTSRLWPPPAWRAARPPNTSFPLLDKGEQLQAAGQIRVLRAEHPLGYLEGLFRGRFRFRQIALLLVEQSQIIKFDCRIGMVGAFLLLDQLQRSFIKLLRVLIPPLLLIGAGQHIQDADLLNAPGPARFADDGQRASGQPLRLGTVALLVVYGGQQLQPFDEKRIVRLEDLLPYRKRTRRSGLSIGVPLRLHVQ